MDSKEEKENKKHYKKHKHYRWIALIIKLISVPILTYAFSSVVTAIRIGGNIQTIGTLLTTFFSLVIYYGVIFFLNRNRNFRSNTPLISSLVIYILVVVILVSLETAFSGILQNTIYSVLKIGVKDTSLPISVMNVNNQPVYLLIGLLVHFLFSFITGIIIFNLFDKILDNEKVLGKKYG